MMKRAAAVEDEAGAVVFAFGGWGFFEVFEDSAFEVVDLGEALLAQEGGGFFAADAAGAEHGDFGSGGGVEVFADPGGEVREGVEVGIDGVGEGADFDFVGVAGVEEEDAGVGDEVVPVGGVDVGAGLVRVWLATVWLVTGVRKMPFVVSRLVMVT